MTRQDYEKIAKALNENRPENRLSSFDGLVTALCKVFKKDNARFDESKFREAIKKD